MPERAIFRERAFQHHIRKHEQHVLPSFVSPPVFLFLWIIIGLSAILFLLAWNARVPVYISNNGLIVQGNQSARPIALLMIPASQLQAIHPGLPVQLSIGSDGQPKSFTVTAVTPTLLSPETIRRQYALDGALSLVVTQPSAVAEVALDNTVSSLYLGSTVTAEIQVGWSRVLSTVPLIGSMIGE